MLPLRPTVSAAVTVTETVSATATVSVAKTVTASGNRDRVVAVEMAALRSTPIVRRPARGAQAGCGPRSVERRSEAMVGAQSVRAELSPQDRARRAPAPAAPSGDP